MKLPVLKINPKLLSICVTGLVILSIAYGVFLTEPWQSRAISNDMDRVEDLIEIDYKIKEYWIVKGQLPASLTELNSGSFFLSDDRKFDNDGEPYKYNIIDKDTYELCSNFELDSDDAIMDNWRGEQWDHPSGPQCFLLDDLLPSPSNLNNQ